jgi:asparagine synthetase B (glutamine-hydrolysing)
MAVIDLSEEALNATDALVLYNGTIYNYMELSVGIAHRFS